MATVMTVPEHDQRSYSASGSLRFVNVRANLMPDEVLLARQTIVVRRRVLIGLAAVVALIVAGFGASWLQTKSADGDLSSLQQSNTSLVGQQSQFSKLVYDQNEVQRVQGQLATLMQNDLPWSSLIATVRAKAPAGVTVSDTGGVLATGSSSSAQTTDPLNTTGLQSVGTLTISGSSSGKPAIATYADRLNTLPGLSSVLITSVTNAQSGGGVTYTITATITSAALGGRFSPATHSASAPAGTTGGH